MGKPHIMMVPYPAQGHVIPLLEFANTLITRHDDIKITFVNVEFVHDIVAKSSLDGPIRFVSIPDGLEPEERAVPEKFIETMWRVVPQKIEELLEKINREEEEVTCLVSDHHLCRIEEVARKFGIQSALFSPVPAAMFPLIFNVPNLIQDGIIDHEGNALEKKAVQFGAGMPSMKPSEFIWCRESQDIQKLAFKIMRHDTALLKSAEWVLCNSTFDLEEGAYTALPPNFLPVGPLVAAQGNSDGHFLEQDVECLEWLDRQPSCSVIYIAFGSTAILSNAQFQQLATGIEQTNRPFIWVVRSGAHEKKQQYPEGFLDRVSTRGRITELRLIVSRAELYVGWAPQQKVLSHPSVACFVSHCGWNSTLESISNGVPILCWPYFSDQFANQSYISDVWSIGLGFEQDVHSGIVTSEEFKRKINLILGDKGFKERALQFKEKIENSVKEGGSSYKNLTKFITWIQK